MKSTKKSAAVCGSTIKKPQAMKCGKAMKSAKPTIAEHTSRPKPTVAMPCVYKGCKVYESIGKKNFRVVPRPSTSVYDKSFSYAKTPRTTVWADVIRYCEKPTIPKDSVNYA